MQTEHDVARIKQKIIDRGVAAEPPVDRDCIKAFEQNIGIQFPEELTQFYTTICNGCEMIDGFEIKSFQELIIDMEVVKKEFIWDTYWIWEDEHNTMLESKVEYGNIELIDIGDGQTWNLIVTGKARGQMWMFSDVGIQPCCPPRSFISWFEYWLDGHEDYFEAFVTPKE